MQLQYGWRKCLDAFAQQSSVHALKHLSSTHQQCCKRSMRRSLSERLFWLVAMLVSAVCFIIFLVHLLHRWERGPLFVGLAEKSQPIWDIPFPAVTICPETKAKTSFVNFTDAYHALMDDNGPPINLTGEMYVQNVRYPKENKYSTYSVLFIFTSFRLERVEALALLCDAHLTENFKLGQSTANDNLILQLREARFLANKQNCMN